MDVQIHPSWKEALADEFEQPYFRELTNRVRQAYSTATVFPPGSLIFNAFNLTPLDRVKVVILGQDPYHNYGQAMGLSFSVPDGCPIPPSLQNIYKELNTDVGKPIPMSGNLTHWAQQGVLLLNATLTVQAHTPKSHAGWGWERFTDHVIQVLSQQREHLVFLLWGSDARRKEMYIDPDKHYILRSVHPSPLSAYRGFFGCQHFSKTNYYLASHGIAPIAW